MKRMSIRTIHFGLILLLAGCASPAVPSPAPASSPTPTLVPAATSTSTPDADLAVAARIQAALQPMADADSLNGAVLVARDGKILFSQAYGLANIETKAPITLETKFHLGSLSKPFTALAVLLLQQQGKLNVQEKICRYLDDCPPAWDQITIHELLIHTSGIPEINNIPGVLDLIGHTVTPVQLVDQFRHLPLDFAPGERYSFSNSGYIVLGLIIEKASGMTYADFVQQNIFDPLQMKNSGYDDAAHADADHATGYKDASTPAVFVDNSINYASAGLFSTVGDLLLWDQSFYSEALLPAALQEEIFTPYIQVPNSTLGTGYGWLIGEQYDQAWIYYSSKGPGAACILHRFPESRLTIIALTNRQDSDLARFNELVGMAVFAETWVSPLK